MLLAYYGLISLVDFFFFGHSERHSEMCMVSLSQQRHGLQGMLILTNTNPWTAQRLGIVPMMERD